MLVDDMLLWVANGMDAGPRNVVEMLQGRACSSNGPPEADMVAECRRLRRWLNEVVEEGGAEEDGEAEVVTHLLFTLHQLHIHVQGRRSEQHSSAATLYHAPALLTLSLQS